MSALALAALMLAGGLAAVARYLIAARFSGSRFPYAVLVVNVIACLIAGFVAGGADAWGIPIEWQTVLIAGVAGGLSTFSTFSVEVVELAREGRWRTASVAVFSNLGAGLAAVLAGYFLGAFLS